MRVKLKQFLIQIRLLNSAINDVYLQNNAPVWLFLTFFIIFHAPIWLGIVLAITVSPLILIISALWFYHWQLNPALKKGDVQIVTFFAILTTKVAKLIKQELKQFFANQHEGDN